MISRANLMAVTALFALPFAALWTIVEAPHAFERLSPTLQVDRAQTMVATPKGFTLSGVVVTFSRECNATRALFVDNIKKSVFGDVDSFIPVLDGADQPLMLRRHFLAGERVELPTLYVTTSPRVVQTLKSMHLVLTCHDDDSEALSLAFSNEVTLR